MKLFLRRFKFLRQRLARGFSDRELWNLDHTMAKFILPRLKAFKDYHRSYPPDLTPKKWDERLDEMIWAFEFTVNEWEWESELIEKTKIKKLESYYKRREKGLKLFAEYFNNLWD